MREEDFGTIWEGICSKTDAKSITDHEFLTEDERWNMLSDDVYKHYGYGGRKSFREALRVEREASYDAMIAAKWEAHIQAKIIEFGPTLEAIDASDCSKKRSSKKK